MMVVTGCKANISLHHWTPVIHLQSGWKQSRVDINNQLAQSPGPVPPSLKNHPTAELDSDMWTCSLLGQTYLRSTSNRNQERKKVGHQSLQRETQAIDVDRVDQP